MWAVDMITILFMPIVGIVATIVITVVAIKLKSITALMVLFMVGLFAGGIATIYASLGQSGWGFILALLPFILIVQHAIFLRIVRRPVLGARPGDPTRPAAGTHVQPCSVDQDTVDAAWWRSVLVVATQTTERYFGPVSLAIRYGTSALAILLVGVVVSLALFADARSALDLAPPLARAAKLGVAGAYVYVLLYLGKRNFHHDVTSGGAMWCGISLAVGPVLASTLSYFFHTGALTSHTGCASPTVTLGSDVTYFVAGLSPRYVTEFVENVVKKAWGPLSMTSAATPRILPITQIRGITPEIAERLAEEGIYDLHGLAMADPLRLIRNTNFDKRQIIAWIDEALLITVLPEHWQSLEKEGIVSSGRSTSCRSCFHIHTKDTRIAPKTRRPGRITWRRCAAG